MNKKVILRYSESFKLQVVKEYEESYLTRKELSLKYGIKGGSTICNWINKYGSQSSQNRIVRVEKPNEKNRIKELEKEVERLKKALAHQTLVAVTKESMAEVIAEDFGVDLERRLKKVEERQSRKTK
ncbi:MAG: transposase [Crocinitomicaceae bacterium]